MSPSLYVRLWLMVFLHYFVWGSWYVTMGTYLTETLHFPGNQVGLAYGSTALGAMLSPFVAGVIADRFMATQRLLGILHFLGAALLYVVARLTSFPYFYPTLIVYTISYMAGHGLTNTLTLHHAVNPKREFPIVMMMGSIGWIAAGWTISWLDLEKSADMFRLASIAALVMSVYCFTLPHTPPKRSGVSTSIRSVFGIEALQLLLNRSFATFIFCSFLICIPLSFYFNWMNVFMNELNIKNAAAKMTLGQVSDVVFLLLLPVLLARLKVKGILLLGMLAWTVRFGLLSWFDRERSAQWMLFAAIGIHGMCYDYIFVMGRMYVDNRARPEIRGAAQGLHAIVTLGLGMFIGSWLAGVVGEHYATAIDPPQFIHAWRNIWLVPAVLSAVLLVAFAVLFTDHGEESVASPKVDS